MFEPRGSYVVESLKNDLDGNFSCLFAVCGGNALFLLWTANSEAGLNTVLLKL